MAISKILRTLFYDSGKLNQSVGEPTKRNVGDWNLAKNNPAERRRTRHNSSASKWEAYRLKITMETSSLRRVMQLTDFEIELLYFRAQHTTIILIILTTNIKEIVDSYSEAYAMNATDK